MQEFIKQNLWRLLLIAVVAILYFQHVDDIKAFLHKSDKPTAAVQPIILNAAGQQTAATQPIIVSVTPTTTEKTTVGLQQKSSKDSPDLTVADFQTYKVQYNGKTYDIKPGVKETQKLEKNGLVVNKEATYTMKLEQEKPRYAIGAGYNIRESDIVVLGEMRLDRKGYLSIWAVGGAKTAIAGIKFNF